jgi:hypothetical protein
VNTGLTPLEPEECNTKPTSKMSKSLQQAYAIAAEGHDLDFYKQVLAEFQEESARLEAEALKKQEEAAAKADKDAKAKDGEAKDKKKKSRKSKAADEDDVEMEDAEAPKSSKKRKKDADSDGEGPKVGISAISLKTATMTNSQQPKKTPKVTKLNAPKTPNGGDSTPAKKASTAKPKKKVTAPKVDEETAEEKKELTEAERLDQREKAILYLRHRLQKGFLSRDQAPKEEEMSAMGEFFGQLEKYDNLEPSIIRTTKIHKVLKAIVKLASIPKDEELGFKRRSAELLEIWNKRMEGESEPAQKSDEKAPETNGEAATAPAASEEPADNKVDAEKVEEAAEKVEEAAEKADEIDEKVEQKMEDLAVVSKDEEKTEEPSTEQPKAAEAEAPAEKAETASDEKDVEGDVSMMTAPEEQS